MQFKKIYISQLGPNQQIVTSFLVRRKELKTKQRGGEYLALSLVDRTGSLTAFMWENVADYKDAFKAGDFVLVKGITKEYNERLQMNVHRIKRLGPSEVEISDFLPMASNSLDDEFDELMRIIAAISNPFLKRLLTDIFSDAQMATKFKAAPAGRTLHHAYIGGLLEHTLSLVKLCQLVAPHYKNVNLDLLVAGAILHDIGKVDELAYDRQFGYTDEGRLIGHLTMEVVLVSERIKGIEGFPEDLRLQLLHLLVSHHGHYEYGSPKLPMTLEALLLHHLDNLDAKVCAMQWLMENDDAGDENWTSYSKLFDANIYRRRIK